MEEPKVRKTTRLKTADYSSVGAYFITLCTENRRCLLSQIVGTGVPDGPSVQLLPHGKIAEKYINQLNDFYDNISIDSYVIMPNHIHLMILINSDANGPSGTPVPTIQNSVISRFVSTFKRFCNKEYKKNIWQSRSYDHIIRSKDDFNHHKIYIYENPMNWHLDELYSKE